MKKQFILSIIIAVLYTALMIMLTVGVYAPQLVWEGLNPNLSAVKTFLIGMCFAAPFVIGIIIESYKGMKYGKH